MGVLEQRTSTPKELSRVLGVNLENVAYHVRILRDFGLIKLQHRKQVGGAVEHHYRALARPRVTARAWAEMPEVAQHAVVGAALDQIGSLVASAAAEGGFSRPESHVSRRPLVLDDEGFVQASKIISRALDELAEAEREAKKRTRRGSQEIPTTAVALLFESPQQAPPAQRTDGGRARSRSARVEPS
jgi:DNA-binding transcriptional ArsR family regulator